jgi:hypothetical protein
MPLYIQMYHGRSKPNQEMDAWGPNGPMFGPFDHIQTSHGEGIQLGTIGWLTIKDDLIQYDRRFYSDWVVFGSEIFKKFDLNTRSKLEDFEQCKADFYKGDEDNKRRRSLKL